MNMEKRVRFHWKMYLKKKKKKEIIRSRILNLQQAKFQLDIRKKSHSERSQMTGVLCDYGQDYVVEYPSLDMLEA